MRTIPAVYVCEICQRRYDSADDALECEARGVDPPYPVGMLHGHNRDGEFYARMVFAVAESRPYGHRNAVGAWACRDGKAGPFDTLGEDQCGLPGGEFDDRPSDLDTSQPCFGRMVTYLKGRGIPVTVWDGKKPMPLAEWLNDCGGTGIAPAAATPTGGRT